MSEELNEIEEVSEIDTAEQERIEHENMLKSFPDTTVFYDRICEEGNVKRLGAWIKDPFMAERLKMLDNHMDESELTYVGTESCGVYYLKGYEKPEPTKEEALQKHAKEIEAQMDALLYNLAKKRGYDDVKSLMTYYNSTKERFRKDAIAFNVFRDDLYDKGYEILDKCVSGELDYKEVTLEYILSQIDPLDW